MPQNSNKELAGDYLSVAAVDVPNVSPYIQARDAIAAATIDIRAWYLEKRSLNGLKIEGVGKKTKGVLELILKEGVDEVRRMISEQKDSARQKEPHRTRGSRNNPSDTSEPGDYGSWDNAVRRTEE